MTTTTLQQIVIKIIKEQELIIGPVALNEAKKVSGLSVNEEVSNVVFDGDPKQIIDSLINRYERLFGRASHEVCREAVGSLVAELTPGDVPSSLK